MKYQLLIFIFLGMAHISCSQTWLSPVVGYDIANMRNRTLQPPNLVLEILDTGYVVGSLVWGARVEQQLGQKFLLAYQFGYSEKKTMAYLIGIAPTESIRFQQYRNSVYLKYYPWRHAFLAAGADIFLMKDIHTVYATDGSRGILVGRLSRDEGVHLAVGGHFKQLELTFYYHHGLLKPQNLNWIEVLPIRSVGASLSYRFKVLGRKK